MTNSSININTTCTWRIN